MSSADNEAGGRPPIIVNQADVPETTRTIGDHWGASYKTLTPSMRARGGALGINMMRLPSGHTTCPFHHHRREDEAFYVLSPVPNNQSGIDWRARGQAYFDTILDFLDQNHLPGLRDNLDVQRFVTPDYFEHDLRSVAGAAFGPEPRLRQSAFFRYHNRSEDVDGLYFVGAGTHPGAGMPGVLTSAKVLERLIPAPAPGDALPLPKMAAPRTTGAVAS